MAVTAGVPKCRGERSLPYSGAAMERTRVGRLLSATDTWVAGWSLLLAAALLGPALAPGFVLLRDMVWVPDLTLRADVLGLGTAVPRAVPSDAIVAVLDEVVPGMMLQKIALLGALVCAGVGYARLAPQGIAPRIVVAGFAVWNPYVVERLGMGHWPLLVGYGALPWVLMAARAHVQSRRLPAHLPLLLVVASLSASAGLATVVAVAAIAWRRGTVGRRLIALALVAQGPWIAAGLAHVSVAADAGGYDLFAGNADGLPFPLAALTLGGIWNLDVVPSSRGGLLAWVAVVWLVALAAAGWRRARTSTSTEPSAVAPMVVLWCVGYGLAVVGWFAPDVIAALGEAIPGLGVLRDSSRMLLLCVPLLAVLVGHGVLAVTSAVSERTTRVALAAGIALVPVMTLPDAVAGLGGDLTAVDYPDPWLQARAVVPSGEGDALYLPLSNYRTPAFVGRPVTDPLPRLLTPSAVVSDDLVVSGTVIAGEDPTVMAVRKALRLPTSDARLEALAQIGIGWVITQSDDGGLEVLQLDDVGPASRVTGWRPWMIGIGWSAPVLLLGATVALGLRRRLKKDASRQ